MSQPSENWEEHFPSGASPQRSSAQVSDESTNPLNWSESSTTPSSRPVAASEHGGPIPKGSVPNYLWPSIGATLCCCAPLGIPAIVFASRVDSYLESGDRAAAEEASNKAKTWMLASFGVAALVWIAIFVTG